MNTIDTAPVNYARLHPCPPHKALRVLAALCAFPALLSLLSTPARAATFTWDPLTSGTGSDGAGTWNTSTANWSNGTDNIWSNSDATDIAVIGNGSNAAGTITIGTTIDVGGITFKPASSGNYTLSSGTLAFGGASPAITDNASGTTTISGVTLSSAGSSPLALTVASGDTLALSGEAWSGTSGVLINGTGKITDTTEFGVSNTSAGGAWTISSGTYANTNTSGYENIGYISAGTFTQTGGVVTFGYYVMGGASVGGNGLISVSGGTFTDTAGGMYLGNSGTGTLTVSGGGVVSITNGNPLIAGWSAGGTGVVNVNGGTLTASGGAYIGYGSSGSFTQTSGTTSIGATVYVADNAGSSGTVSLSGGVFSASGQFLGLGNSGSGTWTQSGGTASFGQVNMNTGALVLTGGTFTATSGLYVGLVSSTVTVSGSGVLNANGGLIDGYAGSGGTVNLNGGTINATSVSHAGGTLGVINFNGGTLQAESSAFTMTGLTAANVLAGGAYINDGGFAVTIAQALLTGASPDGGLTKSGTGTLTLTGANTYNGGTTITSGTLKMGNASALGATTGGLTVNAGTLDLNGNNLSFGALSGSSGGLITSSAAGTPTLTSSSATSSTYGGNISNGSATSIAFTKNGSGTLTLSANESYTGVTTISGGTLQLGNGVSSNGSVAGSITDNATLAFANPLAQTFSGTISGGGSVVESGPGTLTLNGALTYTGATLINGGTLKLSGTTTNVTAVAVNNGGTLSVTGSIGAGALSVNGGGTLIGTGAIGGAVTVAGGTNAATEGAINLVAGGQSDVLTLNSGLTLGGAAGNSSNLLFAAGSSSSGLINLGGGVLTLNAGGADITINITSAGANTFNLLTYGSATGAGFTPGSGTTVGGLTLTDPNLTFGVTGSLNVTGTAIQLVIAGAATPTTAYWLGTAGATWTGTNGGGGNFTTDAAGNNQIQAYPGDVTDVYFAATGGTNNLNNTLGQNFDIKGLTFLAQDASSHTISAVSIGGANTLQVEADGITDSNSNGVTLGMATVIPNVSQSWTNNSTAALTVNAAISGPIAGTTTLTLSNTNSGSTIFNNSISNGTGGPLSLAISNSGSGIVLLGTANTYSGATTIASGILQLGNANAVQNSTVSIGSANGLAFSSGIGTFTLGGLSGGGNELLSDTSSAVVALQVGNNNSTTTYSGSLGGGGSLAKIGSGTLVLSGSNAYIGATNITGGTLQLGNGGTAGSLSTSSAITDNATLAFNRSNAITQGTDFSGNAITGNGGLVQAGSGVLTLTASNTYSGGTTLNAGQININNPSALGSSASTFVINSGTIDNTSGASITTNNYPQTWAGSFTFNGSNALNLGAGTVALPGSSTVTVNGGGTTGVLTVGGVISGTGALTKAGTGTLVLAGNSSYTGSTTVNSGTLTLQSDTAFASTATVNSGGALSVIGTTRASAMGTITVNSGGSLILDQTANGYASENPLTSLITGAGTLNVNNATSGINGGWVVFNNAAIGLSSFTGTVNINSGVLGFNNAAGAWSGNPELNVVSGGLLSLFFQSISVDALTGNGDVFNGFSNTATLTVGANGGSGTFSGVIHGNNTGTGAAQIEEGTVALTKSGTGTEILTGGNTYIGATNVNVGTLQIGNGGTTGSLSSSTAISGSSGGTLAYDLSTSGTVTNSISGGIGVTQAGGGTLTLSATSCAYAGVTTVTNGTLIVAGSLSGNAIVAGGVLNTSNGIGGNVTVAGGTLEDAATITGNLIVGTGSGATSSSIVSPSLNVATPGNTNILTANNITLNSDAEFEFTLNSTTDTSDAILAYGTLTLGGTLVASDAGNTLLDPFAATPAQFVIAGANANLTGTFANLPEGALIQIGQNWFTIDYGIINTNEVTLTSAVPEPGTWAMMVCGIGMLVGVQHMRSRRS